MNFITKKTVLLFLQSITVAGILTGLAGGLCLLDEMTDIHMLNGVLYTMQPNEQLAVLQEETNELMDDGLKYGIVAGLALSVSFIAGLAAFVLSCFIKAEKKQA